jgi:hypothetical protein
MTRRVETPQSQCRVGMARADITPPVGIYHRMWGAAAHDRAEGVHRPLTATALYMADASRGSTTGGPSDGEQLIIGIDHCLLSDAEVRRVVASVAENARIAPESVVVCYSHTHAAGLMLEDRHGLPGGDLIPGYMQDMAQRLAAMAREAKESAREGTIVYGYGRCDLARHRDYWDEERQEYVCGFNPDQSADDTLLVARVTDAAGQVLGTVVNYACHPTTLAWDNRLISPDFPGAMREVVEAATGAPCLFLQGASGELGPKEGFTGCTETADRNGRQLGYAALSTLTALPPPSTQYRYQGPVVSGATLGVWEYEEIAEPERLAAIRRWQCRQEQIPLPYRAELPTQDEIESQRQEWLQREDVARAAGHAREAAECRAMVERQTRMLARLAALPAGPTFPLRATLLRLGDAWWLAVQGESYSLLQTELRRRIPAAPLVVISLAHSWGPSYLPTRESYGHGIYQESIAVLAPGSLEELIDQLAQRMR